MPGNPCQETLRLTDPAVANQNKSTPAASQANPPADPTKKGAPVTSRTPIEAQNILLVTGRLAEPALRRMASQLQADFGKTLTIQVLPITVAALMTPDWIARHIDVPAGCQQIVIPGYCEGQTGVLEEQSGLPVTRGPRDLRRLPEWFGGGPVVPDLNRYSIEIIAEINHAPRLPLAELVRIAGRYREHGADVIDIGCLPGESWADIGTAVRELRDRDFRVSVDSMRPDEIAAAVEQGAELVLSVNSANRRQAVDWGCEVVVVPDSPRDWLQMADTVDYLAERGVPLRIDPILEPAGTGLADSLARYHEARRIWPDAELMMGIGNLTELSDVDSAGVNLLLLAICQETGIRSVLTTEVVNWARSSVRECDIARRLVQVAVDESVPAKNLDRRLVCLRDPQVLESSLEDLRQLAGSIRDSNFRIAVAGGLLHLLGYGQHWSDPDPFELFFKVENSGVANVDPGHAFYLGFELGKASIANQLGKQYEQDEPLNWGYLTRPDPGHRRLKRRPRGSAEAGE